MEVGWEEVEGGRGEGAGQEVAGEVEVGEVGEVLQVELVDRPGAQLVGRQLECERIRVESFPGFFFSPGEF